MMTSNYSSPNSVKIYKAVEKRNYILLETLLSTSDFFEVNSRQNEKNISALDLAVENGDSTATKLLLDHEAVPDYIHDHTSIFRRFKSTIGRAICSGNLEVIKILINRGTDPESAIICKFQKSCCKCWSKIVKLCNLSTFQFLLECTGQKVCDNEWSQKLLLEACSSGSDEIVSYLLDQGVPIDSVDSEGMTAVFHAVKSLHAATTQLLLARGANHWHIDKEGQSLLHVALLACMDTEFIRILLDIGFDVNSRDHNQRTPLHCAVMRSNVKIVELLLERGAELNARDKLGRTPLMSALAKNLTDGKIFNLLLRQKNIDLVQPDKKGLTVLHMECLKYNCLFYDQLLLRPEVDINARDTHGRTPLDCLISADHIYCLSMFFDFEADTKMQLKSQEKLRECSFGIRVLAFQRLKRKIAGFDEDLNIEAVLNGQEVLHPSMAKFYVENLSKEIETMKLTPLLGSLTYYDFLHAKRHNCVLVASKPQMRNLFLKYEHNFEEYKNMLAYKYICGLRPYTKSEKEALKNVENNLDFFFSYHLPTLVVHKIKKYLDIEDKITLDRIFSDVNVCDAEM